MYTKCFFIAGSSKGLQYRKWMPWVRGNQVKHKKYKELKQMNCFGDPMIWADMAMYVDWTQAGFRDALVPGRFPPQWNHFECLCSPIFIKWQLLHMFSDSFLKFWDKDNHLPPPASSKSLMNSCLRKPQEQGCWRPSCHCVLGLFLHCAWCQKKNSEMKLMWLEVSDFRT